MNRQLVVGERQKIYECIRKFNLQEVENYLQNGLDPNTVLTDCGCSLVHIAASIENQFQSCNTLKLLFRYAANPNTQTARGETSLHFAASLGHLICLNLLICNGGDLLRTDRFGFTPIDVSYSSGFVHVAETLTKQLNSENFEAEQTEDFALFLWKREFVASDDVAQSTSSEFYFSCETDASQNTKEVSCFSCRIRGVEPMVELPEITDDLSTINSLMVSELGIFSDLCSDNETLNFHYCLERCLIELSSKLQDDTSFCHRSINKGFLQSNASNVFSTLSNSDIFSTSLNGSVSEIEPEQNFTNAVALNTGRSSQNTTINSYVTVLEEFLYQDLKNNLQFIEKRLPGVAVLTGTTEFQRSKLCSFNSNSKSSRSQGCNVDSIPSLTESIKGLTGDQLREKLKDLGFVPGPVTPTTFKLLQRHYLRLRNNAGSLPRQAISKQPIYSKELQKALDDPLALKFDHLEEMEASMCELFNVVDGEMHWRDGISKVCFNYLLLDPRVTKDLPIRFMEHYGKSAVDLKEPFRTFISSIFYIGKGSRCRPYSHLSEALSETQSKKNSKKVELIKEIWLSGQGVVSLHVFQNAIPVEAWTREASMISAIGLVNLTNLIEGTFYGPTSTWSRRNQRTLGTYLLYKAFLLLLLEGERQIRPRDIPKPNWVR